MVDVEHFSTPFSSTSIIDFERVFVCWDMRPLRSLHITRDMEEFWLKEGWP